MDNWEHEVDKLLHLAYYTTSLGMTRKFAYNMVDKALRSASDVLSSESISVVNNTMSVLQWSKCWSHDALDRYWLVKEALTQVRKGKPPTHRQICNERDALGKRWWTVEHEYPILIPKTGVLDNNWSESDLRTWFWKYGRVTIITQPENARLLNHTNDMDIASKRYETAQIIKCSHPHFDLE